LIDHVLGALAEVSPMEVVAIVNSESLAVRDHVMQQPHAFPVRWIVESTPSSMHSFLRVLEALTAGGDSGPFLLSTVDTIAPPGACREFVRAAAALNADVVLALTRSIDDEKPLLVDVDTRSGRVRQIGNAAAGSPLCTAGWYMANGSVLREASGARDEGLGALRQLLSRLLDRGYRIAGVEVPACIDVDRPADVAAAERFVRQVNA
jgi:hypothetical protein